MWTIYDIELTAQEYIFLGEEGLIYSRELKHQ